MVRFILMLFGIIVLQTSSKIVSSENGHHAITSSIEQDLTLDNNPNSAEEERLSDNVSQNKRRKRFYDYIGFGYPSYNSPPTSLPFPSNFHYSKRDETLNTAVYGTEDALSLIYRRLQQVARDVSQQNTPRPPETPIPVYLPFFYIPHIGCGCNSQEPTPPVIKPSTTPKPTPPTSHNTPLNNTTTTTDKDLVFEDRFPIIDDAVQNWGISVDKSELDVNNNGDGSRPINLNPVPTEEPVNMPVPPVEHGTIQAGAEPDIPIPQRNNFRPMQKVPDIIPDEVTAPQSNVSPKDLMPSQCDVAILSCCIQPQITTKCFESQGCKKPTIYGNPCDPNVQLMVVTKFQNFYNRKPE